MKQFCISCQIKKYQKRRIYMASAPGSVPTSPDYSGMVKEYMNQFQGTKPLGPYSTKALVVEGKGSSATLKLRTLTQNELEKMQKDKCPASPSKVLNFL